MSDQSLTVNTPESVTQCENTTITWDGGVEPYYVGYIASGSIGISSTPKPAVAFQTSENQQEWLCDIAGGTGITLTVRDSTGTIVYSDPIQVRNSSDITCLPGYVAPSSSPSSKGLSKGAIGGIVAGSVVGAIIIAVILLFLVRKRRRTRRSKLDNEENNTGEKRQRERGSEDDQEREPKVEPYLGEGCVDLCEPQDQDENDLAPTTLNRGGTQTQTLASSSGFGSQSDGSRARGPVGELERETKAMLGVQPQSPPNLSNPSSNSNSDIRQPSNVSPIPIKSQSGPNNGPSRTSPVPISSPPTTYSTRSSSTATNTAGPVSPTSRPPVDGPNHDTEREAEVEYVRHTDGGGMRVELPPLYTDVPRREGDGRDL